MGDVGAAVGAFDGRHDRDHPEAVTAPPDVATAHGNHLLTWPENTPLGATGKQSVPDRLPAVRYRRMPEGVISAPPPTGSTTHEGLVHELADIATGELIARLVLAAVLGAILGYERESRSKTAGLRTHTLVALGAAMFTVAGAAGFDGPNVDTSRLAAGVITGIGFIGAGTILRSGLHVTGLTTAATLWMAGALGVGAASGLYAVSASAGAIALASLLILGNIRPSRLWGHRRRLEVLYEPGHGTLGPIYSAVANAKGEVKQMWMSEDDGLRHITMALAGVDDNEFADVIKMISGRDEVLQVSPAAKIAPE